MDTVKYHLFSKLVNTNIWLLICESFSYNWIASTGSILLNKALRPHFLWLL